MPPNAQDGDDHETLFLQQHWPRCSVAIPVYARAPGRRQGARNFNTKATLAGHEFNFALADALKKGPVVLYFYPAAFTSGCTVEAHEFAEATS